MMRATLFPFRRLPPSLALLLASCSIASARDRFVRLEANPTAYPSAHYANMSGEQCKREITVRGIEFLPLDHARGVLAPVRIPKGVGGVLYRTQGDRMTSPYDVFDCRLVLALSDFSRILLAHDIDEVLMFSAWRPPSKRYPESVPARRHPGALAIDAYRFGKRSADASRQWLEVKKDFHGRIGSATCGNDASLPPSASSEQRELRSLVCEAADQHLFTSILTPNYNRAHYNHFHMEITPHARFFLVH